jgi:hypothetical protein
MNLVSQWHLKYEIKFAKPIMILVIHNVQTHHNYEQHKAKLIALSLPAVT